MLAISGTGKKLLNAEHAEEGPEVAEKSSQDHLAAATQSRLPEGGYGKLFLSLTASPAELKLPPLSNGLRGAEAPLFHSSAFFRAR